MTNTKNSDLGYWRYQALYWAIYSAISLSFAIHYAGWTPAIIVGYMLYPFYSIGLTHLLHLEFRRWRTHSRTVWAKWAEVILATAAIGLVQTFLIGAVDLLFEGRNSLLYQPASMMYVALGTTYSVGLWVFVYHLRQRREQRTQLQLALREAELSALGSPDQSALPLQLPEFDPRAGGRKPRAGSGHDYAPGEYLPLQPAPRGGAHGSARLRG